MNRTNRATLSSREDPGAAGRDNMIFWSIYGIIHICTAVVDEVKNDHRSKFSNLSNWKEEA